MPPIQIVEVKHPDGAAFQLNCNKRANEFVGDLLLPGSDVRLPLDATVPPRVNSKIQVFLRSVSSKVGHY